MIELPNGIEDDNIKQYLLRVIQDIDRKLNGKDKIIPMTKIPERPELGRIYYFPSTIAPTITTAGFWGYKQSGWVLLG